MIKVFFLKCQERYPGNEEGQEIHPERHSNGLNEQPCQETEMRSAGGMITPGKTMDGFKVENFLRKQLLNKRELQWLSKEETQLSFLFPLMMPELGVMLQGSTP